MKKSNINELFRSYVRDHLSPTPRERDFVSTVYESVQNVLGESSCLQIGSYPRFTSITPLHDLDVLYILGAWNASSFDPSDALNDLQSRLESEYDNPTQYDVEIGRQTHSITIVFSDAGEEIFSVDIVPAYISGRNEFGGDMYVVPEIAAKSHSDRRRIVAEVSKGSRQMAWIKSDPRGYISVATQVNQASEDFRKAVKLIKGWRASCKEADDDFPLKSFHLEQAVTCDFQRKPGLEIFDAVFNFFCGLPELIEKPQIPDRADSSKKIDAYVSGLTQSQKDQIKRMRDFFLIKLENIQNGADISDLLEAGEHERASDTEEYLFDSRIPMLVEHEFTVIGRVLPRDGGFRGRILDAVGLIEVDRQIEFRRGDDAPAATLYKWKVKNDNKSKQPRGEITDHGTMNDPENTAYNGRHYVECYAIKSGVCIGRSRQDVVLQWVFGQ
ncbi:MAG: nucleotidyltransferase [Candidatus Kaiserbacteria bacterium]|nr:nucleotidyltransferase [Candidatus Kaiserbacteria bacterium]